MSRKILGLIFVLSGLFVFIFLPQAGADDFYKGKTIRFVVGFAAGGAMTCQLGSWAAI